LNQLFIKEGSEQVNEEILNGFLSGLEFPINFLDFETYQVFIPSFEGQRPFLNIPFQYSLHILHKNGRLEHSEFLNTQKIDPRPFLIEKLLSDITGDGSVIAYHSSFEKQRIEELAQYCQENRQELCAIVDRLKDLKSPFAQGGYYHPAFNGSFSLKSVLPALFPDDTELDYSSLDISNGGLAMAGYQKMIECNDPNEKERIKNALLEYCRLDTLAMVKIYEFLKKLVPDQQ